MFEDWLAIQNLLGRYAELINTGEFDELGKLFEHGRVVVEGNPNITEGSHAVAQMYRESTQVPATGPDSLLYTTNSQYAFDGDVAHVRSYFIAMHDKGNKVVVPVVGGRYRDTFRKRDGKWGFEERRMLIDLIGDLGDHISMSIDDYLTER